MNEFCPGKYARLVDRMLILLDTTDVHHALSPWVEMHAAADAIVALSRQVQQMEEETRETLDRLMSFENRVNAAFPNGLKAHHQEIRNKAIDDACNTINRLSADGELEGCSSDFVLSFASDLVQSLKEG